MFKEKIEQHKREILQEKLLSEDFMELIHRNIEPMNTLITYYKCAIMEVETKIKVLNEEFSLEYDRNPIEGIKSRIKSTESLARKVREKNIPLTIEAIEENIKDIAGIRVICSFPEDIYMLADCILAQDDITLVEKKDYIQNPKSGGYRSLHLIVSVPIFLRNEKKDMKVEIQLRTIAMDFWASLEHKLKYKKEVPDAISVELTNELRDCADKSAQLDRRMQEIRNRLSEYE